MEYDLAAVTAQWDQILASMRPIMRNLGRYHAALIEAGIPIGVAEMLTVALADAQGFPGLGKKAEEEA